jgi:pyruvate dehydrogenase E1 component beta subunit
MLVECLRAQELLGDKGISAEVIDPISLVPLDIETILTSVARTGRLLVVDTAWTNCGASAEILARVAESLPPRSGLQMARMGFAATTCPPSPALEEEFYPNPGKIALKAHSMIHPGDGNWTPDSSRFVLTSQFQFRGPF